MTDDSTAEPTATTAGTGTPEDHLAALNAAIDAVVSDAEGWAADARAKLQTLRDAFASSDQ